MLYNINIPQGVKNLNQKFPKKFFLKKGVPLFFYQKFLEKNFLKKGVVLYGPKKFPRKILRESSCPLYDTERGGIYGGGNGGRGTEGGLGTRGCPYTNYLFADISKVHFISKWFKTAYLRSSKKNDTYK
jgi:hypothetical protein